MTQCQHVGCTSIHQIPWASSLVPSHRTIGKKGLQIEKGIEHTIIFSFLTDCSCGREHKMVDKRSMMILVEADRSSRSCSESHRIPRSWGTYSRCYGYNMYDKKHTHTHTHSSSINNHSALSLKAITIVSTWMHNKDQQERHCFSFWILANLCVMFSHYMQPAIACCNQ